MNLNINIKMLIDAYEDDYFINIKYEVPTEMRKYGYEIITENRENEEKTLFTLLGWNNFPFYMHAVAQSHCMDEEELEQIEFIKSKVENSYGEFDYLKIEINNEEQLKRCSEWAYYQALNGIAEIFFSNEKDATIIVKNDEYILKAPFHIKEAFILWICYDALAYHYVLKDYQKFEQDFSNYFS